jgi:NTP pyrophosphatase (non-canonical NTP hydrolase)
MDLREFSKVNRERNAKCFPDCKNWTASEWMLALIGEIGEAANLIKKYNRGDWTTGEYISKHKNEIAMELGDEFVYLDLLAHSLGIELEDCVIAAFNKVSDRKNYPVKIDSEFGKALVVMQGSLNVNQKTTAAPFVLEAMRIKRNEIWLQNLEYDALQKVIQAYQNGIQKCAVVDDDFPEVKRRYEAALRDFIQALKNNGRI